MTKPKKTIANAVKKGFTKFGQLVETMAPKNEMFEYPKKKRK